MTEEGSDPYEKRKAQRYSWLFCWKQIRKKKRVYEKGVGLKIAKMIPVDFSQGRFGSFLLKRYPDNSYYWSQENCNDNDYRFTWNCLSLLKPCICCFAPTVGPNISFRDNKMVLRYHCLRNHMFEYHGNGSIPQCCGPNATCFVCAEKLAEKNNLILPK